MSKTIYLIASLRNPRVPIIGRRLREAGHVVFDDWFGAGPEADDYWKDYEYKRGREYLEAVRGDAACNIFDFDMDHIRRADTGVLVLPAGKSAHLELGFMIGRGQEGFVLFDGEPSIDRWELMYKISHGVFLDIEELIRRL